MQKMILWLLVCCLLLSGCSSFTDNQKVAPETREQAETAAPDVSANTEQTASEVSIYPLPENIMENLKDATLAVSLEDGDAYVDDTGKMQMDVQIYTYDKYDMVDISMLKVGDTLVTHSGDVDVNVIDRREDGSVWINGGLSENGFDLVTDDDGVFYECGYNDAKNWYQIGEATIRVSVDFVYHDTSDLEQGEIVYYPGSFLIGEVADYNFTPYNTTIRVEDGQIVEMHRVYVP